MVRKPFTCLFTLLLMLLLLQAKPGAWPSEMPTIPKTESDTSVSGPSGEGDPLFQKHYDDAMMLYDHGQKEAAMYKLQLLLKKYPASIKLLRRLAEMAVNEQNRAYAMEVLQKAARLTPKDVEVRFILVDIYRAYHMPILEIMMCREILEIEPDNARALQKMAELYDDIDLPDFDMQTRQKLKKLQPADYQNLRRLAVLLYESNDEWEETLVYRDIARRFPEKRQDLDRLARLYGIDTDLYRQLLTYKEILRKDPGKNLIKKDFRKVYDDYRKEQGIRDYIYLGSLFTGSRLQAWPYQDEASPLYMQRPFYNLYPFIPTGVTYESSPYYDQRDLGVNASFEHIFLFGRGHVGIDTMYRNTQYVPRKLTTGLFGQEDINTTYFGMNWETRDRWENNIFRLHAGLVSVDAPHGIYAGPGTGLTAADSPWLENTPFGGSQFLYRADYYARLADKFWGTAYVDKGLMDDTNAIVRLITKQACGVGFSYLWPSNAFIGGWAEQGYVSDGNSRTSCRVFFDYPLLVSGTVRDFKGTVKDYLRPIPDAGLFFNYEGDYINDSKLSPYYQSYQNEWQNRVKLYGDVRIENNLFLIGEASHEWGKILQYADGFKVGLLYEEPVTLNTLEINYQYRCAITLDNSQVNPTFTGDNRTRSVELKLGWHF
jgi:hypothetical protein